MPWCWEMGVHLRQCYNPSPYEYGISQVPCLTCAREHAEGPTATGFCQLFHLPRCPKGGFRENVQENTAV
jgi:hypothetical protein